MIDDEPIDIDGKKISRYDAEQKLRYYERGVRRWKREADMLAGICEDNTRARMKIAEWQGKAKAWCDKTGLRRDYAREFIGTAGGKQVYGLGRKVASAEIDNPKNVVDNFTPKYGNAKDIQAAKEELSHFAKNVTIPEDTDLNGVNRATKQLEFLTQKYNTKTLTKIDFSLVSDKTMGRGNHDTILINKNIEKIAKSVKLPDEWKEFNEKNISSLKQNLAETQKEYDRAKTVQERIKYNDYIKDIEKDLKDFENANKFVRGNVMYTGKEVETTITHEYGHELFDQKIGQLNKSKANKDYVENSFNPLYKKCLMVHNTYWTAMNNGDIYKISRYASRNPKEFAAECFAIYEMGVEKLPDYIVKMIEEVIK